MMLIQVIEILTAVRSSNHYGQQDHSNELLADGSRLSQTIDRVYRDLNSHSHQLEGT